MEVKIEGNKIIIELPISERSSKSGKTTIIASTNGNVKTDTTYKDKEVVVGVNVYIHK